VQETGWKIFWQSKTNRNYFWIAMLCFTIMFVSVFFTLRYVEARHGFTIEDWSLALFGKPRNFSIAIFAITYFAMVYAISTNVMRPRWFLHMLITYAFMQLSKCLILLCVPLDPPTDILPLSDPILETLFYGGNVNLKDLFYSGHVATVCIAFIYARPRWMKYVFVVLGVALAFMMAQQRVHYILDVAAAPLFVWIAYRISSVVESRSLIEPSASQK
jgi:hypothetical protein